MVNLVSLIILLVVGAAAGWLAGQIMKGRGLGLIGNLIVGIVGAVIGGYMFGEKLTAAITTTSFLSAVVGAIILLAIVGLVKKKS